MTSESETMAAKINLLLVDDRPENLLALEAVLEPLGANLLQARSGEAALKLAREHDFAAVLLDVQMPGMDGFETASRLRKVERNSEAPILFITASHADEGQIARGYALGAVDFILKPFSSEVMQRKTSAYIDLFQRTHGLQGQIQAAVGIQDRVNILVVNDDLAGLLATEASLAQLGATVHLVTARTGRQALSLLLKQTFALILLSVHIPDVDGFEVAAVLRRNERCRHIPLVFVTASAKAEADVAAGYACGALDFIFTPISAELLCSKLTAILNQFRQQRLLARSLDGITGLNQALQTSARELESANASLEQRVRERVTELAKMSESLRVEITEHKRADLALQQTTKELLKRNLELEHLTAAWGRELYVVQLKREVNALCRRLGEPQRYESPHAASIPGEQP